MDLASRPWGRCNVEDTLTLDSCRMGYKNTPFAARDVVRARYQYCQVGYHMLDSIVEKFVSLNCGILEFEGFCCWVVGYRAANSFYGVNSVIVSACNGYACNVDIVIFYMNWYRFFIWCSVISHALQNGVVGHTHREDAAALSEYEVLDVANGSVSAFRMHARTTYGENLTVAAIITCNAIFALGIHNAVLDSERRVRHVYTAIAYTCNLKPATYRSLDFCRLVDGNACFVTYGDSGGPAYHLYC